MAGPQNVVVAQSGGPTAAINASAAGVIETALDNDAGDRDGGGHSRR